MQWPGDAARPGADEQWEAMANHARPAKTIGILTSGGDCSGLNAAIRAVVCRAIEGHGWRVLGIRQGTMGLLRRPVEFEELGLRIVTTNILRMGGTILGTTNKGDPFAFPMSDGSLRDRSEEVIAGYRELGLDALIGIGGDGSFAILRRLAMQGGLNLVGAHIQRRIALHVAALDTVQEHHRLTVGGSVLLPEDPVRRIVIHWQEPAAIGARQRISPIGVGDLAGLA